MFFKKKPPLKIESPTGIEIVSEMSYEKKKRIFPFVVRAILVYFVVFGTIGCFTSCFDISYNSIFVAIILLFIAFYMSFLYYNKWTKNIGYIFLFILFFLAMTIYYRHVNSGFYAIVNDMYKVIEKILNLPGVKEYDEQIANRYLATTVALSFLGCGGTIIINMLVSGYMSVVRTMALTMPLLVWCFYFELKPSIVYALMLFVAYGTIFAIKRSGTFKDSVKDEVFFKKLKKGKLNYTYSADHRIMIQTAGFICTFAVILLLGVSLIFPDSVVKTPANWGVFKSYTDKYVAMVATNGVSGLFNRYNGPGGLNGGQLGGVSQVTPDFQTDLIVTFAPYTMDTIYLKSYVGIYYGSNSWATENKFPENKSQALNDNNSEVNQLKNAYDSGDKNSGYGVMEIENVDAGATYPYLPYYTYLKETIGITALDSDVVKNGWGIGEKRKLDYYIYNENVSSKQPKCKDVYLKVPEGNIQVIDDICKEQNFGGTNEEIIEQVQTFFADNYPYTMKPGRTPNDEDFVNYFLTKNKKGYCSHFASAATLIFRRLGIPARYVEGYVVDYGSVMDAELVDGEKYDDWYKGYSSLGETAVVSVEVNDSSAHAWVEIYDENFGWKVVEVTPASTDVEENEDFWSVFSNFASGNNDGAANNTDNSNTPSIDDFNLSRYSIMLIVIAAGILLYISVRIIIKLIKRIKRSSRFHNGPLRERVINRFIYTNQLMSKSHTEFSLAATPKEILNYYKERNILDENEAEKLHPIWEAAAYSDKDIDEASYNEMIKILKMIKKGIVKNSKFIIKLKLLLM